jgi:hypothetical protein
MKNSRFTGSAAKNTRSVIFTFKGQKIAASLHHQARNKK